MAKNEILGDDWIGETHFDYEPVRDTTHHLNVTTGGNDEMEDIGPPPGMGGPPGPTVELGYWWNDGATWAMHHTTPRATLFGPNTTPYGVRNTGDFATQ